MNPKQEILALLEIDENDDWDDVVTTHARIRAILETHALTDVDPGGPDRCMTCGGTGRL